MGLRDLKRMLALVNCGSYFAIAVVVFMVVNPLIEWARWRIGLPSAW